MLNLNNNKVKKQLLILLLALLTISCDNSIEGNVKRQFKLFASENFDDPNSIKEIISVEPHDTVSLYKAGNVVLSIQKNCDLVFKLSNAVDSVNNAKLTAQTSSMDKLASKMELSELYTGLRLIGNIMSLSNSEVDDIVKWRAKEHILNEKTKGLLDTIDMIISPPLYGYRIKFRQNIKNELKIQEYYGYVDSLSQNIVIRNSTMDFDSTNEINDTYKVLYNLLVEYRALISEVEQAVDNKNKAYDEWFDFANRHRL